MAGKPWSAGRVDGWAALYQTGRSRGTDRPPSVGPPEAGAAAGGPAFRRYYEACVERWSQPRHALDQRFVHLTLLLDQGEEAQGLRWAPQARQFQDLREVLAAAPDPALVLLGPPGSGKSTLLRHFDLDNARTVLAANTASDPSRAPMTFFIALNGYGTRGVDPPPRPHDWLCERWAAENPDWPPLDTLLRQRRVTLLLDALNEMPQAGPEPLRCWKGFLADLTQRYPGNRAIFSCRSLDYSATLSSKDLPVPQMRIEALSDDQIQEFLALYCPDHHVALWDNLADSPQLEVCARPIFSSCWSPRPPPAKSPKVAPPCSAASPGKPCNGKSKPTIGSFNRARC